LASVERRRCSNEAKTRKSLKLAGVPGTPAGAPNYRIDFSR